MKTPSRFGFQLARKRLQRSRAALAAGLAFLGLAAFNLPGATIADWQFNEADPTADSSGNGNTLGFNGDAVTFSSDVATNAPGATNSIIFDGATYAQTVATLNLSLTNAITIEFFARYAPSNGLEMFYAQNNPNNVVGAFYLDVGEAGPTTLKVAQRAAPGFETDIGTGPIDGGWHHYALTVNESGTNSAFKIYVDGFEVDAGGVSGALQTFINDYFTIGAYPPTYIFNYNGEMGEMRISSGILTPAQFLIGAQPPGILISHQPLNTAAVTNNPATFTIVADVQNGNPVPTLQYQWQMNGTNISGATNSSYTLPSATLNNNGELFDVLLSARGAASVTSSNATLTVATNATIADWQFNAANPTADSSGNGNVLVFNGDAVTFSSDVATNAPGATNSATFDGAAFAQTAATLNLSLYNAITIEFFAKYAPPSGLQMFYSQNNPNNTVGAFYLDVGEAGHTALKVAQRAAPGFETDSAAGPTDGAWHHFALTVNESGASSALKIYVDGFEVDGGGTSGPLQSFLNDYFTIGAYPPTDIFNYNGEMGEMRVSFGALTPAEFLIGAPPPAISIASQPLNAGVVTNNPATFTVVASVQNGNPTPTLQYQWQINGTNILGATNSSYTLPSTTLNNNLAELDVVLSALGAGSVTSSIATLTVVTNATIAYWQFNAADPTADSSGNGNTLAFNGDAITFSGDVSANAPGTTNSAVFDGASYAETAGTLNLTPYDQLTIEFFAKYSSGSPLQMFYAMNNVNTTAGAFYLDTGEAGPTLLKVTQRTSVPSFVTEAASEPTDGNWHHYALTIDESGALGVFKIYVDGFEVDGSGTSGAIQPFLNDFFTIGGFPPTYDFEYNGLMEDLRISTGLLPVDQFLTGPAILQISTTDGNAVISWPRNAGNYSLQQTAKLPGSWSAVTNSPASSGLYWQVTVPASSNETFYRLIH